MGANELVYGHSRPRNSVLTNGSKWTIVNEFCVFTSLNSTGHTQFLSLLVLSDEVVCLAPLLTLHPVLQLLCGCWWWFSSFREISFKCSVDGCRLRCCVVPFSFLFRYWLDSVITWFPRQSIFLIYFGRKGNIFFPLQRQHTLDSMMSPPSRAQLSKGRRFSLS